MNKRTNQEKASLVVALLVTTRAAQQTLWSKAKYLNGAFLLLIK